MSAYFTTHHFSPHWTTPRHPSDTTHHLQPPPITTTITAPSIAPPSPSGATASPPSPSHRHLTLDTLAHLLHDFHVQNEKEKGDRDPVTHRTVARPHFDLLENKGAYVVYGELAGLGKGDVRVEVDERVWTVTVSGRLKRLVPPPEGRGEEGEGVGVVHREGEERGAGEGDAKGTAGEAETERVREDDVHWHVTERKVGEFRRAFQFPIETVDMGGVSASMKDGLLCVVVPKKVVERKDRGARRVEVA